MFNFGKPRICIFERKKSLKFIVQQGLQQPSDDMDLCFQKIQRHWRDGYQALDARLRAFLDNILLARKEVLQEFSEFHFRLYNQLFRTTDHDP